jgi:hypothetical protein
MSTLQILFVALAAGLSLFWLGIAVVGPRKIDLPNIVAVLRYGSVLRTLALILALLPAMITIYVVAVFPWKSDRMLAYAGGSLLATCLIAGLLLIEVARSQVCLTEDGIIRYSPWAGRSELLWSEIERIRYSNVNSWFVLLGEGRTIRVSRHFRGVKAFVETVKSKIAAERCASAAAAMDAIQ